MVKICGIIVEYNPFHNGHAYHIKKAREQTGADLIVAVMSGNFLQRGEPAIVDKWQRAAAAVANGVDVVIELPVEWAVQSADYFAAGAVRLLEKLGCEAICFGTDEHSKFDYVGYGQFYQQNHMRINQAIQAMNNPTLTYAEKMIEVMRRLNPTITFQENQPNHLLALSYAKENALLASPMRLVPIKRKTAAYHSEKLQGAISSATAIRKALAQGESVAESVPDATMRDLTVANVVCWENYWLLLNYRIITSSLAELRQIYQMVDGLEYRFKKMIRQSRSFDELINQVASKRYPLGRIQRLCVYILCNFTKKEITEQWTTPLLRPLAYNQKGQQFLAQLSKEKLAVVARFAKKESLLYPLTLKADQVYQLGNPQITEQNFGRYVKIQA